MKSSLHAHWGYRQITIHPVVLHYRCHCLQNVTEYMIFLTDDMQDGNMVKAITDRVLQHTKQKGLKHMVIYSLMAVVHSIRADCHFTTCFSCSLLA